MRARWILSSAAIIVLAVVGFAVYSWRAPIRPVEQHEAAFDPALIAKGAELARIGNCGTCHTPDGGPPYAGGRPMTTPFGTIYTTNITPDPQTGIGDWTEEAFRRAMQEGVRRDGAHLYPAFPYDHFTQLSADDIRALYAFVMTRDPVVAERPANDLLFLLNMRPLIAGWKLLFFRPGPFEPDESQGAEWNRGAYLVEALAHCGACHTPRNVLGAEKQGRRFAGGEVEGWHAPALNADSPAPVAWTQEQLVTYLRQGFVAPHGVAAGPMQDIPNNLGTVGEDDVRAIAAYIGSMLVPATAERAPAERQRTELAGGGATTGTAERATTGASTPTEPADGAFLYAAACALCHEPRGQQFSARGIELAASKVVALPDPRNLLHVILDGIKPPAGAPAALMPGFGDALTDPQVTALVTYLRAVFSDEPMWNDIAESVRKAREPPKRS